MKKLVSLILAGALACTTLLAGCSSEVQPSDSSAADNGSSAAQQSSTEEGGDTAISGKLTLNGSTSMTSVCDALGEAFIKKYPDVSYEKANTGSGAAVTAVNDGTALIGDLSRDLKDEENPDSFDKVTLALDGIAIVVHADNKVSALTSEQIADIFTGKITDWSEVGGDAGKITVIGREAASGTRDGFESIMGVEDECAYAAELPETGDVVAKIGSDASAIGYVSLASVSDGIKAVDVDGVAATEENVANGTYVVQRPFVEIYKKDSDSELIKAWFDFVASDEGQQIIKDQKLVPVEIEIK